MNPILTIDVGAGTTDVLVFYPETGVHYKAVTISPIRKITQDILNSQQDILITGTVMGGGSVSKAVMKHAQSYSVYMTPEAAQTINDDLDRVRQKGITVIAQEEVSSLKKAKDIKEIEFGDLSVAGVKYLLDALGGGRCFSFIAGAVQDHGVCPENTNPLDYRHQMMKERIAENPSPDQFLFAADEILSSLTRMGATAKLLSNISHEKLFMMDTGAAAIVGASLDPRLKGCKHCIIIDIGNSHTLGAVLSNGLIGGFFEYHTDGLSPKLLPELMIGLGNGTLTHEEIIAAGGHGAFIRACPGFDAIEKLVVTGPRRNEITQGIALDYIEGAPLGDNMMTGTAGLLESINRRECLGLKI
jgi:uncharacterized protein (DUF1786 family)